MTRCDEFYDKVKRVGNFCDKAPRTFREINAYLNDVLPVIESEAARSEILEKEDGAIAPLLSEGASRPLIREQDPFIKAKAIKHIVKKAEENVMDGKNPRVVGRDVEAIIEFCRNDMRSGDSCVGGRCEMPNPRKRGCIDCQTGFQVFKDILAVYCPLCGGTNLVQLPFDWSEFCEVK
jgi:hypothetical protein